jgi:hypothetical protein
LFVLNGNRINVDAPFVGPDGTQYVNLRDPQVRQSLGITELPDPERKDPRFYFVQEQDQEPYVVNTPRPLEDVKAGVWESIKQHRDELMRSGGARVDSKWYHSDTHSKVQQLSLLNLGANIPAGLEWKTMDGSKITMSPALALAVFQAQVAQEHAIYEAGESHKIALDALTDVDQVASYDWLSGWPEVYQE